MSEEIKQLIDYLQGFVNDDRKEITKYGVEISQNNTKLLVNYIEQLQQENQRLKQWDKNKDSRNSRQRVANAKLMKENKELKEENKRAYAKYINCRKTESKFEYILTEFEKSLEGLRIQFKNLMSNDKTTKYLNNDGIDYLFRKILNKLQELKEGKK